MIGAKNLNAWVKKSEKQKAVIKHKATEFVQDKVRKVLRDAVSISPMWSGNMAFNWQIETTVTGPGVYMRTYKAEPWQSLQNPWNVRRRGDPEVVTNAMRINENVIRSIKWNSRIKLSNYSEAAEKIEAGEVKLRPSNLIPGNVGVLTYLKTKYKFIEL